MRPLVALALSCALFCAATPSAIARHPQPTPSPTLVPTPAPTERTDAARIADLRARVADLARSTPGHLGIAFVDLYDDTHVSARGSDAMPLGNVAKLAIAFAAYRFVDQKRLHLEERVTFAAGDLRGAPSEIAALHPRGDVSYTYWELLRAMLVGGDNTASAIVLRRIGGAGAVQGVLDRLGLRAIRVSNDADARASTGTPDTVAALLAGIAEHRLLYLDSTSELYDALAKAGTEPARLRAGFGPSVTLAGLSGTAASGGSGATNDAAIATFPDGRRVIVVVFLGASTADSAARDAAVASVGRAVDEAFR